MSKHYRDYCWKGGIPRGISPILGEIHSTETTYKIPADPYNKRISVEKYQSGRFQWSIYDSALFDFRHLKRPEQQSWQKVPIKGSEEKVSSHIYNQDDRLILIEEYHFEEGRCRECRMFSPQGFLLSIQKILYASLGDMFNGVILYDSNGHIVLTKRYEIDSQTFEFTELLEEHF